jgi:hypothetical protein
MKDKEGRNARRIEEIGLVCFICLSAIHQFGSLAHWFIGSLSWQSFEKTCQVFKT